MDKSKEKEKDANAKERQGSNGGGNGGGLFSGRTGTRYGAGWRTYFGSSNERGGGEDEAIEDDEEKVSKAVTPADGSTAGKTPGASAPASEKDELESSPDAGKPVQVKPEAVENGDGKPKRKPRRTTRKIKEEADDDSPLSAKKRKGEHSVDFI
jgi:hypothetical protein